jgi:hypothetical protein
MMLLLDIRSRLRIWLYLGGLAARFSCAIQFRSFQLKNLIAVLISDLIAWRPPTFGKQSTD